MGERGNKLPYQHEETIAAFDRERAEAQELSRRHYEIVSTSRRNDRIVGCERDDKDR